MIPRSPSVDWSSDQIDVLASFETFLDDRDSRVLVLSGPAGTGKTTLTSAMISSLERRRVTWHMAALTGRAAAIARRRTGHAAGTLHSYLYRFDSRASKVVDGLPSLVFSLRDRAEDGVSVLIVDEASMLGDISQSEADTLRFGSGNLAADLLVHLFGGDRRVGIPKLVLVGDPYQLPPVHVETSIAFEPGGWDRLAEAATGGALPTMRLALTTVHRQDRGGAILDLAMQYRDAIAKEDYRSTPRERAGDADVTVASAEGSARRGIAAGIAATPITQALITHTNNAALAWNRQVREARWGDPDIPVFTGDLLVNTRRDPRTGLENGELFEVISVAPVPTVVRQLGREVRLRPATFRLTDRDEVADGLLLENSLESAERTISRDEFQVLWVDFRQRNRGLRESTPEFWETAFRDPVLNPIIAKFGYALTCHRAQGGQWEQVIVDFPSMHIAPDSLEGFRWAYTAVTRAEDHLTLIAPPRRSVFSRLAPHSTGEAAAQDSEASTASQSPDSRRARAEAAVLAWADATGVNINVERKTGFHSRYHVLDGAKPSSFDIHFRGTGIPSLIVAVPGTDADNDPRPAPIAIQRAAFAGAARPGDPRIEEALKRLEEGLSGRGLDFFLRNVLDWRIEIAIGNANALGVLVVNFRKSGVFSSWSWRPAPDDEVRSAVELVLNDLARD